LRQTEWGIGQAGLESINVPMLSMNVISSILNSTKQYMEVSPMTRFAAILTATGMILGLTIWTANAQTQRFGAAVHTQIQNATPIVKPAACRGTGAHCPPGYV
jgi:hypothetical protein